MAKLIPNFLVLLALCACQTTPDEMLRIPAGWFSMGENDGRLSNQPQHRVYLDAYSIQKTEVTVGEFAEFIDATGYSMPGWDPGKSAEDSNLPVTGVRWRDADAYCRWHGWRLPTEAEWEKAARGTDWRYYPWGDEWDNQKANTLESGTGEVLPVGSLPAGASPYGLMDMSGNALEWVADNFDSGYYQVSPVQNPTGSTMVGDHVLRGGSFASPPEQATTYFRDSSHSTTPNPRVGFRCALSR